MIRLALGLILAGIVARSWGTECVVLLHGLGRTSASMAVLAEDLEEAGYEVENVDYPSREHPIDSLADLAIGPTITKLNNRSCTKVHFVSHSMGGILIRSWLGRHRLPRLGRVVMLGPPNGGSEVIDNLGEWPVMKSTLGPAGGDLGTDSLSAPRRLGPVDFELGIIAGDRSVNWINSSMIHGVDDGKVSVASTKVQGMTDHIVIHTTHPLMMRNSRVIAQVKAFLSRGRFDR